MFKHKTAEGIVLAAAFISLLILLTVTILNDMVPENEHRSRVAETTQESVITIRPRADVECYVLPGASSTNPRTMSCVLISRD